jgi:hypothetical protein
VRRIIWTMSVSVEGYMEGPDHDIGWHLVDEELHGHMNDWIGAAGLLLEGRVTCELMANFWPTADQDPDAPPTMVEFADLAGHAEGRLFAHAGTGRLDRNDRTRRGAGGGTRSQGARWWVRGPRRLRVGRRVRPATT